MPYRRRRRIRLGRQSLQVIGGLVVLIVAAVLAVAYLRRGLTKEQYLARGTSYVAEKKYAEAIIEFRNVLKNDPRSGETRAKLADAYLNVGDARNAIRETVAAADLLPDDVDAQLKAGQFLLLAGRYEDAKARAERALARDPKKHHGAASQG